MATAWGTAAQRWSTVHSGFDSRRRLVPSGRHALLFAYSGDQVIDMTISRELFERQRHRRFGRTNPEIVESETWAWMLRRRINPYQAPEELGAERYVSGDPDWCFTRFGMSKTKLGDGRSVFVGGEYEDFYDEKFCIYNDVIIRGPRGGLQFLCYPRDVFPPTDFHSATLVDRQIILIGSAGYADERTPGRTPVFTLNIDDFQIAPLDVAGNCPGWIFRHVAALDRARKVILVKGGETEIDSGQRRRVVDNFEEFELDLQTRSWRRTTNNNWQQFSITLQRDGEGHWFETDFDLTTCLPRGVAHDRVRKERRHLEAKINGIRVELRNDYDALVIVIRGDLHESLVKELLDTARAQD